MSIYTKINKYAEISAFYAINLSNYDMKVHAHNQCEIMYVSQGRCNIYIDGHALPLTTGQFIFIDEDVPHRLYVDSDTTCSLLNIEFSCSKHPATFNLQALSESSKDFRFFLDQGAPYILMDDQKQVGFSIKDLVSHLQSSASKEDYLMQLLFSRMLIEVSLCVHLPRNSTGIQYLKKATTYIEAHLTEELNVALIADFVGIHRTYLQKLFSNYLDTSIIGYINQQRITQACFLLQNSQLSITEIAFQVGYNSRQHFGHVFFKHHNMRPKQYRILHPKNPTPSTGITQQVYNNEGILYERQIKIQ